jgi:hypothetical protein
MLALVGELNIIAGYGFSVQIKISGASVNVPDPWKIVDRFCYRFNKKPYNLQLAGEVCKR